MSCCAGACSRLSSSAFPRLRFRGIYLAITTLAMHYAIIYVLTNYQAIVGPSASAGITVPAPSLGGFTLASGARLVLCAR